MKTVNAPPGATRLIESLRNMGYDCSTAIADLIDNSISAGAILVDVQIHAKEAGAPAYIAIADNGKGMDRAALHEAMRFGAFQEYSDKDLGKYGLGLKTASLSQCRRLIVASRLAKSTKHRAILCWDLDHVFKKDQWDLLAPELSELKDWERDVLDHDTSRARGTVVLWDDLEGLPLLSSADIRQREKFHKRLIEDVIAHLRMVFHRFLQGLVPGRKKLVIRVNGNPIKHWDPFCLHEKTTKLAAMKIGVTVKGHGADGAKDKVEVQPFILPAADEFSSPESRNDASGPRNWNFQQGFYFYRNHRLLQSGGWSYLRAPDEHTKLLRIAVNFPSGLDQAFEINITKMRAFIPAEIRDQVRAEVTQWVKAARARYDKKPEEGKSAKPSKEERSKPGRKSPAGPPAISIGPVSMNLSNAPSKSVTVTKGAKPGQVKAIIPHTHELAKVFEESADPAGEARKLATAIFVLLEAVCEDRLFQDEVPLDSLRRALKRQL